MISKIIPINHLYSSSWFRISIILLSLSGLCVVGVACLLLDFFPFDIWKANDIFDAMGADGPYRIDQIILTNELDSSGRPVRQVDKFRPSEPIIAWVSTKGAEGIIGMRWYYEDELFFERFSKTQNNQIDTYIQSSPSVTLPEGNYRVDIHITNTPRASLHFTIEQYHPEVIPAQPTPENHQDKELSAFVEVPFAFDEVWTIGETEWMVNEVKITLLGDEEVFVSVAVETDLDLANLSQEQAIAITKPIATYAVKNGYLEEARSLQIDGRFYSLHETIYINLVNRPPTTSAFEEIEKPVYRIGFDIRGLLNPES